MSMHEWLIYYLYILDSGRNFASENIGRFCTWRAYIQNFAIIYVSGIMCSTIILNTINLNFTKIVEQELCRVFLNNWKLLLELFKITKLGILV